ncbi:metabotropic glutamate receptor 3-like [Clytia hemisphaerica]|uniref:G-protein coupled receptors family 3 profile domain-containing protein n=1 Tax=Clytia hemisphaerica TaxID=252671 RepID=A0A7M5V019_9CNID
MINIQFLVTITVIVIVVLQSTPRAHAAHQRALEWFLNKECKYNETIQDLDSDFLIGALFPVHTFVKNKDKYVLDTQGVSWVESFLYAVNQINTNSTLLPGLKLGYDVRDTCKDAQIAVQQTLDFLTGTEYYSDSMRAGEPSEYTMRSGVECKCVGERDSRLIGIVGGARSTVSSSASFLLGTDSVPQISYASTSPSLSEKARYPNFLRTVPSDLTQTLAISDLMVYFKWSYVSVLASDDEYGRLAIVKLRENLRQKGICFAVDRLFDPNLPGDDLQKITDSLKKVHPESKVVILWADLNDAFRIIRSAHAQGMNDTLWVIGTETWGAERKLKNEIDGARVIKLAISDIPVKQMEDHLNAITYRSKLNNTWIPQIWQQLGICPEFGPQINCYPAVPSGRYLPRFRHENVIASVYALGYGLHQYLNCNDTKCNMTLKTPFDYDRFLRILKEPGNRFKVPNSTMYIEFNQDGDVTVNAYNFLYISGRENDLLQLGHWYGNNSIEIDDELWERSNSVDPPKATCAFPCQPGTYKVAGSSACCWQCLQCYGDGITSTIDAPECQKCKKIEVPSPNRDRCIPLTDMRLSFDSSTGQTVIAISLVGFVAATFVLCIFIWYWNSPVVKSSSREISVIQLLCMILLFCYPVLFMFQASTFTCILRNVVFCSLHTFILSFILLKTYRLLRVFQPKRFSKISKFLHNKYQLLTSFIFVIFVLLVLTGWYYGHMPDVILHISKEEMGFIYHCGSHENIVLYCIVGFIIFLSLASGFMAFRARRLPSNFKEAQYIWLAMFISCLAWITMFPLYITQTQSVKPLVLIGVNGASTVCMLLVLYGYKIHIILFQPHLNSTEHFSKLAINATVTTFMKDADPSNNRAGSIPQNQQRQSSVISFDFDGMFDEYKNGKVRSRSAALKQSFKHFPRSFRASKHQNAGKVNSPTKHHLTEKERKRQRLKAKNKTLQFPKRKREEELSKTMPPKSASFDDGQTLSSKYPYKAEFFIDLDDNKPLGSRTGSDASLIKKMNNANVDRASSSPNQSENTIDTTNQLYDSMRIKNSVRRNKIEKQQSVDSPLSDDYQSEERNDLMNQSERKKMDQLDGSMEKSSQSNANVNGITNGFLRGMSLEDYDTFV